LSDPFLTFIPLFMTAPVLCTGSAPVLRVDPAHRRRPGADPVQGTRCTGATRSRPGADPEHPEPLLGNIGILINELIWDIYPSKYQKYTIINVFTNPKVITLWFSSILSPKKIGIKNIIFPLKITGMVQKMKCTGRNMDILRHIANEKWFCFCFYVQNWTKKHFNGIKWRIL
jgi:hypothetical protein